LASRLSSWSARSRDDREAGRAFGQRAGASSASYATVMIERVFDMVMVVVFFAVNLIFFEYIARDADATRLFGWDQGNWCPVLVVAAAGIYGLSAFRRRRNGALTYLERKVNLAPKECRRRCYESVSAYLRGPGGASRCARPNHHGVIHGFAWLMVASCTSVGCASVWDSVRRGAIHRCGFCNGLSMLGLGRANTRRRDRAVPHCHCRGACVPRVEQNKAASVAIILHLVIFTPATVFGMYYLAKRRLVTRAVEAHRSREGRRRQSGRRENWRTALAS